MDLEKEFNLVFNGEIAKNHDIFITKQKLSKAFKVSDEKIATLFSGQPSIIKKGLSSVDGLKLQQQMLLIGAVTYLQPSHTPDVNVTPTKRTSARIPPVNNIHQPSKVALALQPIKEPPTTADDTLDAESDNEESDKSKFTIPQIKRSLNFLIAITFLLMGISCLILFSPYADHVVRKGFVVGGLFVFIGYRKLTR